MVRRALGIFFMVAGTALGNVAETPAASGELPSERRPLRPQEAVTLGVVEGVTEFLPVSSTGHLILANRFLGLDDERRALTDAAGNSLWLKKPSEESPAGEPLTLKEAANAYVILIQAGAIAAVLVLYWRRLLSLAAGAVGRDPQGRKLLGNLLVALLPAVVLGFLLDDWIDKNLFSVGTVIAALAVGAVGMLAAERWRKRRLPETRFSPGSSDSPKQLHELSWGEALRIGAFQCLALWPGMSRSMVTIVGGYFAGLRPALAAEFSFILGLPTLGGAALLKMAKSGPAVLSAFGWGPALLGAAVAALSALIAVRFLVGWLSRRSLEIFAWYRLGLAAALLLFFYL